MFPVLQSPMLLLFFEEAAGLIPAPCAALSPWWCRQACSLLVGQGRKLGEPMRNFHSAGKPAYLVPPVPETDTSL